MNLRKNMIIAILGVILLVTNGCANFGGRPQNKNHSKVTVTDIDFKTDEVGDNYAVVSWTTKVPTGSQVQVTDLRTDITTVTPLDSNPALKHSVRIKGLKPDRQYRIQAIVIHGNGQSSDRGPINTISTAP